MQCFVELPPVMVHNSNLDGGGLAAWLLAKDVAVCWAIYRFPGRQIIWRARIVTQVDVRDIGCWWVNWQ